MLIFSTPTVLFLLTFVDFGTLPSLLSPNGYSFPAGELTPHSPCPSDVGEQESGLETEAQSLGCHFPAHLPPPGPCLEGRSLDARSLEQLAHSFPVPNPGVCTRGAFRGPKLLPFPKGGQGGTSRSPRLFGGGAHLCPRAEPGRGRDRWARWCPALEKELELEEARGEAGGQAGRQALRAASLWAAGERERGRGRQRAGDWRGVESRAGRRGSSGRRGRLCSPKGSARRPARPWDPHALSMGRRPSGKRPGKVASVQP